MTFFPEPVDLSPRSDGNPATPSPLEGEGCGEGVVNQLRRGLPGEVNFVF